MSGSSVTNKPAKPRTKCSSESEESCVEQELYGLEEGGGAETDEEGEGVGGEGQAGTADRRVKVGPRSKPSARGRKKHEATHIQALPRLVTLHDGQRSHSSPRVKEKERRLAEES